MAVTKRGDGPIGWDSLIVMLEQSFERSAWHGKNLSSAIKGIDAVTAHRVPIGKKASLWQIVLHCAYWAYRGRMKLIGSSGRSFPRKGSDWIPNPDEATEEQWRKDIALLSDEFHQLLDLLVDFRDGRAIPAVDRDEVELVVNGVAFHAIYHASQISQFRILLGK